MKSSGNTRPLPLHTYTPGVAPYEQRAEGFSAVTGLPGVYPASITMDWERWKRASPVPQPPATLTAAPAPRGYPPRNYASQTRVARKQSSPKRPNPPRGHLAAVAAIIERMKADNRVNAARRAAAKAVPNAPPPAVRANSTGGLVTPPTTPPRLNNEEPPTTGVAVAVAAAAASTTAAMATVCASGPSSPSIVVRTVCGEGSSSADGGNSGSTATQGDNKAWTAVTPYPPSRVSSSRVWQESPQEREMEMIRRTFPVSPGQDVNQWFYIMTDRCAQLAAHAARQADVDSMRQSFDRDIRERGAILMRRMGVQDVCFGSNNGSDKRVLLPVGMLFDGETHDSAAVAHTARSYWECNFPRRSILTGDLDWNSARTPNEFTVQTWRRAAAVRSPMTHWVSAFDLTEPPVKGPVRVYVSLPASNARHGTCSPSSEKCGVANQVCCICGALNVIVTRFKADREAGAADRNGPYSCVKTCVLCMYTYACAARVPPAAVK